MEKLSKDHVYAIGRTINVNLMYPRMDGAFNSVEVGLTDVRAADSILISYDFERDGYVIKQASKFELDDEEQDPDWQEVAFIQAWGRR